MDPPGPFSLRLRRQAETAMSELYQTGVNFAVPAAQLRMTGRKKAAKISQKMARPRVHVLRRRRALQRVDLRDERPAYRPYEQRPATQILTTRPGDRLKEGTTPCP
jgi:hypothetical protein